ncbi:hypothetical protein ACFQHW_06350 [Lapidilactobacillus achengensis]|uniref:Uncharacterized protein n=1 Tax=Lapidilactobacillus achengensis TaxID=2486000 RepID=A0ABW1UQY4_9LACO|nr:hypothetical protein [Lapidilactobacillus achengensis]
MDKKTLKAMVEHPEYLMNSERVGLKQRIQEQKIIKDEIKDAAIETAKSQGRSIVSHIINMNIGNILLDIIETGDRLKSNLDDAKKAALISEYLQKVDDQEQGLMRLADLITDPYGLSIYSKITALLSDSPFDDDLISILSEYLAKLSKEPNLGEAFSKSKTILNLIDKVSPLALIVLKNYRFWPRISNPGAAVVVGGVVQGDNSQLVAECFQTIPALHGIEVGSIRMAILDLQVNGLAQFMQGTDRVTNQIVYVEMPTDSGTMLADVIRD